MDKFQKDYRDSVDAIKIGVAYKLRKNAAEVVKSYNLYEKGSIKYYKSLLQTNYIEVIDKLVFVDYKYRNSQTGRMNKGSSLISNFHELFEVA